MLSDHPSNKIQLSDGGPLENVMASRKLEPKVDKESLIAHQSVPEEFKDNLADTMR